MIAPGNHETMTDDEVIEAYLAMGLSAETARAQLWALRYAPPGLDLV